MKIKNKDNILITSGTYKGKTGKVIKIITTKRRALVKLFNHQFTVIEIDLSNLVLRYRKSYQGLTSKNFSKLQKLLIQMRQINNQLNSFFSLEELNNLLKIRYLENIKKLTIKNDLLP